LKCRSPSLSLSLSVFLSFSSLPPPPHTQVNLQAAKSNYERELSAKEEAAEEARRNLIKQLRDLEAQIDDERKQKSQAQSAQKKIESELAEVESQIDAEAKGREDAIRMYKKTQVSMDNKD
jgi:myosin protein heavy chain